MNKLQLEEFMVFEDKDGEMGVIIKSDSDGLPWWKRYQNGITGQVFEEQDKHYNNIAKLFKVKYGHDKQFCALKFMYNGGIRNYNCVYEYVEPVEEIKPVNIMINLTINNPKNLEDIMSEVKVILEKSNFTNP